MVNQRRWQNNGRCIDDATAILYFNMQSMGSEVERHDGTRSQMRSELTAADDAAIHQHDGSAQEAMSKARVEENIVITRSTPETISDAAPIRACCDPNVDFASDVPRCRRKVCTNSKTMPDSARGDVHCASMSGYQREAARFFIVIA